MRRPHQQPSCIRAAAKVTHVNAHLITFSDLKSRTKFSKGLRNRFCRKQERVTGAVSLACLEIRSRNEEGINSTRNRIYSLKFFTSYFIDVDTFYLFLNCFSTSVSVDQKYVCGRRLYACINKRKLKGLDSREITSIIARDQNSDLHGTSIQ